MSRKCGVCFYWGVTLDVIDFRPIDKRNGLREFGAVEVDPSADQIKIGSWTDFKERIAEVELSLAQCQWHEQKHR